MRNKTIAKDAALEWFHLRQGRGGQVVVLGYAVGYEPQLAPLRAATTAAPADVEPAAESMNLNQTNSYA